MHTNIKSTDKKPTEIDCYMLNSLKTLVILVWIIRESFRVIYDCPSDENNPFIFCMDIGNDWEKRGNDISTIN